MHPVLNDLGTNIDNPHDYELFAGPTSTGLSVAAYLAAHAPALPDDFMQGESETVRALAWPMFFATATFSLSRHHGNHPATEAFPQLLDPSKYKPDPAWRGTII